MPQDFARGAAKVVASVVGLRALGVWCGVCSVSRNFVMEKECLEDLLVNGLHNYMSQCVACPNVVYSVTRVHYIMNKALLQSQQD